MILYNNEFRILRDGCSEERTMPTARLAKQARDSIATIVNTAAKPLAYYWERGVPNAGDMTRNGRHAGVIKIV